MSHTILTIGAATRDIFLVSDKFIALKTKDVATEVLECVSLGSKIEVDQFVATTGGGATNAAATFSSLGFKTAIICRLGDDASGHEILEDLKMRRINTTYVNRIRGGQTAFSTLLTMKDGERTVLVFRGVSKQFSAQDIHWSAIRKSKWVYLTSLGGNAELAKNIIDFAHKHHVKIAWNPGAHEINKKSMSMLPLVDVLIMNKEEERYANESVTSRPPSSSLPTQTLPSGSGGVTRKGGGTKARGKVTLVTDGARGTTMFVEKKRYRIGTSGKKGISKTGAGDAFGSGFVAALIKFNDPVLAAKMGTISAESVIQHLGAKKGVLREWPGENILKKIRVS